MSNSRDIRRCALQALYQFDCGGTDTPDIVHESLAESPGDGAAHDAGFDLAQRAWETRDSTDNVVEALTPDWPTHRQPIIDRNILRLAYHEMTHGETPPKVAINEAVELAKEFGTDKSPGFINGVLDRLFRQLRASQEQQA